jgi:serine phosphatase RsbU (regulator of sigma subunit)
MKPPTRPDDNGTSRGRKQMLPTAPRPRPTGGAADLSKLHLAGLPRLPLDSPFDFACWSRPMGPIGGDLMAAWPAGPGRLFVLLGDVMGHDLASAMVAQAVRLDLHRVREAGLRSPAAVLQRLDHGVRELFRDHFVTAVCGVLDAGAGTLTWSLAGHPPLLLRGPDGDVRRLHHRAFALGLNPGERYHDEVAPLTPGSTVVLYSDGICEALGAGAAGPLALAGLLDGVDESAERTIRRVRRAVKAARRTDDRAALAARVDL